MTPGEIWLTEDDPLSTMQEFIHRTAVEHGWWEGDPNIPEKLALIHSEVSEALEEYRTGIALDSVYFAIPDDPSSKPEGFGIELADAVIRILDLCAYLGIDMEQALIMKHNYNLTRSYKHGGKTC